MHCPFCQSDSTKVIDSRLILESNQIRRRRRCVLCRERFNTYEKVELSFPRIIKRDRRQVAFKEEKLRAGVLRALEKRSVTSSQIEALLSRVIHRMITACQREVTSAQIGEWVLEELLALDEVAYIRFASVYRCFQNINEFQKEINRLVDHEG